MRKGIVIAAVAAAAVIAAGGAWWGVDFARGSRDAEVSAAWGSSESRELEITFGPCSRGWSVAVSETVDDVTLWVTLNEPVRWGQPCSAEAAVVTVALDEPLGDRRVVDRPTGHTVVVHGRDDDGPR